MNIDIEKLRNELKKKVDEIIDSYLVIDNTLIEIPKENIYMEFDIDNQSYIAFTESSKDEEEIEMMFAKVDFIEGNKVLRNIELSDEYEYVVNEFNRRLESLLKEEDIANA